MWKCLKCFEISDSFNKMSWHVEKHGLGVKCEKIEDSDKLKWVPKQLYVVFLSNKHSIQVLLCVLK